MRYLEKFAKDYHELPIIYFITPTDNMRLTQLADLTRLRNTLWLVPKLVWIIIEDSHIKTKKITDFIESSNMECVHLNQMTPAEMKISSFNRTFIKGAFQRNKGINWLRKYVNVEAEGVVYFGDDDNTYDIRLFEEVNKNNKYFSCIFHL